MTSTDMTATTGRSVWRAAGTRSKTSARRIERTFGNSTVIAVACLLRLIVAVKRSWFMAWSRSAMSTSQASQIRRKCTRTCTDRRKGPLRRERFRLLHGLEMRKARGIATRRQLRCLHYYLRRKQATPKWANEIVIEGIYQMADAMGQEYEAEHIVPLNNPIVCGLHCEANLRVWPKAYNAWKSNHWWPGCPVEQGELF